MANANVRSAAKAGLICFPFHVQLQAKSRPNAPQQTTSLFYKQLGYSILRIALLRTAPQYCLRNFLLCVTTATADNLLRWYSL
jgi:hypothetical protein